MAQRQVWAVVAVLLALAAGLVFLFYSGRWHWADTRLERGYYTVPRR